MLFKRKNYGFIPEVNPNVPQYDLIFAGEKPKAGVDDWRKYQAGFKDQDGFPFCVSYATMNAKYAMQKMQTGKDILISPYELFFRAGGNKRGSVISNNLRTLMDGGTPYDNRPRPETLDWSKWDEYATESKAEIYPQLKSEGYSYVPAFSEEVILGALSQSPLIIGVSVDSKYMTDQVIKWDGKQPNHGVALLCIDSQKYRYIQCSLAQRTKLNPYGIKKLDPNYPIMYAHSLRDLPDDWPVKQKNAMEQEFGECLNHYGKPRRYEDEVKTASKMLDKFKSYKNNSVIEASGRFWTVYINAITYGGYSYTDVVNDCYNWRRTGQHAFDLNKTRA